MQIVYQVSRYLGLLIVLATMIVAFTWHGRKGKLLLCLALLLSFLASLVWIFFNLLFDLDIDYRFMRIREALNIMSLLLHHGSGVLLLFYVIVARRLSLEDRMAGAPVAAYSPMQSAGRGYNASLQGGIGAQGGVSDSGGGGGSSVIELGESDLEDV
jgi:uncharacterized membrane protein YgcG